MAKIICKNCEGRGMILDKDSKDALGYIVYKICDGCKGDGYKKME